MGAIAGLDCKLYRQTTGTRAAWPVSGAAPNLDEIANVKDVTANVTPSEGDATTRGGGGYKATVFTVKELTVEWEMVYDSSDADLTALMTAATARSNIALAILDGGSSTVGTKGWWADFAINVSGPEQPIEGVSMMKVTAKAGYSSVPPAWITVA